VQRAPYRGTMTSSFSWQTVVMNQGAAAHAVVHACAQTSNDPSFTSINHQSRYNGQGRGQQTGGNVRMASKPKEPKAPRPKLAQTNNNGQNPVATNTQTPHIHKSSTPSSQLLLFPLHIRPTLHHAWCCKHQRNTLLCTILIYDGPLQSTKS
jgi:hypothetical protein